MADAARRAVRGEARGGLPRRCLQLSAVPAARAVSVLAGQPGARAVRRPALDLRRRHRHRHPAGDLDLRGVRRGSRQRHRGAGGPIQRLPRRRTRRLQGRFRSVAGADADAAAARLGRSRCWRSFRRSRAASSGASSTPASRRRGFRGLHGRAAHPRSLRHWRRRRRAVGRGGGGHARRAGGADRKGPDGRRVPQHRLRAVEGDDRRGQARRGLSHQRAVRHQAREAGRRVRRGQRSHPSRHRRDRAERFQGALHRARRPRDRGRGALPRQQDRRRRPGAGRPVRDQGPPLRDRDRLAADRAADFRDSSRCPISPTRTRSRSASGRSI